MSSDLNRRIAVAGVGIPLGVTLIYFGGWSLGVVAAVLAAVGCREFYQLARGSGAAPLDLLGVPAAALLVLLAAVRPDFAFVATGSWVVVLTLGLTALPAAIWLRWPSGRPTSAASVTVLGAVYTGGCLAFAVLLRELPVGGDGPVPGALLLIFPLVVTWMGDSAAYFAGSRWGRRKLMPSVSPAKTVEGGLAGLGVGMATAGLFAVLALARFPEVAVSPLHALLLGLLLGVAAQVGDLAESLLKREAGAKDSGTLLPGHGGVLDRFDAVFLTLPLTYAFLSIPGVLP